MFNNKEDLKNYLIENYINRNKSFHGLTKKLTETIILFSLFLPEKSPISRRIYHILNEESVNHYCKQCINFTKWNRKTQKYSTYCSSKCRATDSVVKDKRAVTNIKRYGATTPLGNKNILEKVKTTNLKKYGATTPLGNKNIRVKVNNTNLRRYGFIAASKNPLIKKKHKENNFKKYGVVSPAQLNRVKHKICETNIKRYGTKAPAQNINVKQKMLETNKRNHGGLHNMQSFMGKSALDKLNNQDYMYTEHIINKKPLIQIAKELNCGDSIAGIYLKKHNISTQRYRVSIAEEEIALFVSSMLSNNIRVNVNNIIKLELDIFIPSYNLAIEYCGLYWHSEIRRNSNYHRMKYDLCKEKGIRLITIFEDEWLENRKLIENKLKYILGISTEEKIFARKCIIKEISTEDKTVFFDNNHIQGNGPSSINLGLYYNNELVACMGFIRDQNGYNLSRYATSKSVIGGFTKLLSYFEKTYNPSQIYTFADLRWSEGNLYYKSGFVLDKTLSPDYMYIIRNKRFHKFNFRHRQLKKILEHYDSNLSEHQNCLNHNIYRIYDCGKLRFVKNY